MAAALLPNTLWELIEPLLPLPPSRPTGGRPRVSDRACLTGILFVLRSGIPWQMLPQELGCGSGMTCWRRLRDWQAQGVWDLMHFALLNWLARGGGAASTQNQALSSLLFLYREVLQQDVGTVTVLPRARMPARVPVVLTPSEVRRVLE